LPDGCFVVGNRLMGKCYACGKIIRINKPFLGSMHLCLTDEELGMPDEQTKALKRGKDFMELFVKKQ